MRRFDRAVEVVNEPSLASFSWAQIHGLGTTALWGSENVASFTDNAGGDYTLTWAVPYRSASSYAVLIGSSGSAVTTVTHFQTLQSITASSVRTSLTDHNTVAASDPEMAYIIAIGEF